MIAIIDYGMGNIHSVNKALQLYGAETLVTDDPKEISRCQKAVLPGVGAFDDAMRVLNKTGLILAIKEVVSRAKPFLGICLGMQLLFEESQEAIKEKGLGLLDGSVRRFDDSSGLKIPHMGWNQLSFSNGCPLFKDMPNDPYVYFCHSYYADPKDKSVISAFCKYGVNFAAAVWKDNVYGVQFHPEKSQLVGLKIIENFVRLC